MKSYIPTFDWNNGDEIFPFDWLWDDDSLKATRPRTIKIRRR